jgi:hypothetical protein
MPRTRGSDVATTPIRKSTMPTSLRPLTKEGPAENLFQNVQTHGHGCR